MCIALRRFFGLRIPVNDISYIARHSECNEESPYAHPSSRFSRSYGDSSVEAAFRMTEGNCLIFYFIVLFCRRLGDYQELRMTALFFN